MFMQKLRRCTTCPGDELEQTFEMQLFTCTSSGIKIGTIIIIIRSDFEKHLTIKNCDKTFLKIILRLKNC